MSRIFTCNPQGVACQNAVKLVNIENSDAYVLNCAQLFTVVVKSSSHAV